MLTLSVMAQGNPADPADTATEKSLGEVIDNITYNWDEKADELNNYAGLTKFCLDEKYRYEVLGLLRDIHHYDSVLYERLTKAARYDHNHELKKTIKDIEKFEDEYSMRNLVEFLKDECHARSDIEHDAKALKEEIGSSSYDGQIYLVETELNKFIKHITKRMDKIREHVHHLHIN